MAELKEGQQIIFRHPGTHRITQGTVKGQQAIYLFADKFPPVILGIDKESIAEWCDASEAWNALTLQNVRAGTFEWNEGLTVEPKTI